MGVMVTAVCPDLFQRTALVDFSIPGDVEMIADVTESPVKDMILTASLRRKGLSFRRGTAMNDNQSDGTHKATYSSVITLIMKLHTERGEDELLMMLLF